MGMYPLTGPDLYSGLNEVLQFKISPEELQLYYQIVLEGRRELPYAPDGLSAFEMTLLRLLAFNLKKKGE